MEKLDEISLRVLGCLMEKKVITPDQYPLTLNSLVTACNQKTSRSPVMSLTIADVGPHLSDLEREGWVSREFGARAERYVHHVPEQLSLDVKQAAIMTVLMLRGPQTLGEIRTHTSRIFDFESLEVISESIDELMAKESPLAEQMEKLPGAKEARYQQLLCPLDPSEVLAAAQSAAHSPADTNANTILSRIDELEQRVEKLEAMLSEST